MKTSLQAITYKAQRERRYRFRNLYTMLNRVNLEDSFHLMNRQAAPGVDGVTMRQYRREFSSNMSRLTDLLKRKRYRPQLVRRVNIPKGNGKLRPLGLPAIADKLVQTVCARILGAIYEQDFLPCSYGYRPRRGAGRAAADLQTALVRGKSRWVVEADIKGFFDSIDHDWLMRMLANVYSHYTGNRTFGVGLRASSARGFEKRRGLGERTSLDEAAGYHAAGERQDRRDD